MTSSIEGRSVSPRRKPLAASLAAACGALVPALAGMCLLASPTVAGATERAFDAHALGAGTAGAMARMRSTMLAQPRVAVARASSPAIVASAAVTSCGDDANDFTTLRHAVLTANPGDTIDLSVSLYMRKGKSAISSTGDPDTGPDQHVTLRRGTEAQFNSLCSSR